LNKSESPSPKHVPCQVWLKLAQWFLRRSRLKEKLTPDRRTTDGQTDGRTDGRRTLRHAISSLGPLGQVS